MKRVLVFLLPLIFMISCVNNNQTTEIISDRGVGQIESINDSDNLSEYIIASENDTKIFFSYPSEYSLEESTEGISIYGDKNPETGYNAFGLRISEEETIADTFEDFTDFMEQYYIFDIAYKLYDQLPEEEIGRKVAELVESDRYSFEQKQFGNISVLLHKRDFASSIGNVYSMFVVLGDKKVLHFFSESDHDILENIYSSIQIIQE